MTGRIVEVTTDGVHLSAERGFLSVSSGGEKLGQVALGDIAALVVHAHGVTFSVNVVARLSDRGVPVVLCDRTHQPMALVWPVSGHYEQGHRMQAQADASKPLRKGLWRELVKAKIMAQANMLELAGVNPGPLNDLARKVRSGDPDNIEAQAARRYWQAMMGDAFRRDRNAGGANALLNYGYIVLRAATARAILAAGLHPSLSIHHQSRGTALRLADDLMEPFRPYVDLVARRLAATDSAELTPAAKADLAAVLTMDLQGPMGASPVQTCIDRLASSLAQIYLGERKSLELPGPPLALSAAGNRHS